jgi:TldD protein
VLEPSRGWRKGAGGGRRVTEIKDIALRALDAARAAGAAYADARFVQSRHQDLSVKQGRLDGLEEDSTAGVGVRVLVDGAWGFACTSNPTDAAVTRAGREAVAVARASARTQRLPVTLGTPVASRGNYRGPCEMDPFTVSLEDKLQLLLEADEALRGEPDIRVSSASAECTHWVKHFVSSEGSEVEQEAWETGAGIECSAVLDGDMQKRSFPNSFGRQVGQGGWELVRGMALVDNAPRIAAEACALLRAEPCPSGRTTVILDASQVGLQVHESCGHPTELDRVYGMEAAYAGTSFMTPELLGELRYGSDLVTIVADATVAGALGTFGWDDEGVPAQRVKLVDRGRFTGYLTSRETAARLDRSASMGAMRADGWSRIPLIRMTNINLLPGESSLEEMISGTDQGIFMSTNRSWSIDDRRLNFQFGTELAYEVRGGKLGRMLKNANYAGITPEFWNSCDAVGNADEWRMWGLINCGKGQPGQTMRVGHGAPPARFTNVQVGIR